MQQFPNDPPSTGTPPTGPGGWAGQPGGMPPAPPTWAGQAGAPQATPSWTGQSSASPFGVQPTLLDRSTPWPALRLISRVLKIIAWIELVIGTIASLAIGASIGSLGNALSAFPGGSSASAGFGFFGLILTLFYLITTAIGFLVLYGAAEGILVLLAIEKNTRKNE